MAAFPQFPPLFTGLRMRGEHWRVLVPLGYDADGRTPRIIENEAKTVRKLYALYREHGTVTTTTRAARQQ